jgi:hypothetical protein
MLSGGYGLSTVDGKEWNDGQTVLRLLRERDAVDRRGESLPDRGVEAPHLVSRSTGKPGHPIPYLGQGVTRGHSADFADGRIEK